MFIGELLYKNTNIGVLINFVKMKPIRDIWQSLDRTVSTFKKKKLTGCKFYADNLL